MYSYVLSLTEMTNGTSATNLTGTNLMLVLTRITSNANPQATFKS